MDTKLLLLDRPANSRLEVEREVEYLGPWATSARLPDELGKPRFEPYRSSDDVYDAGIRSIKNAEKVLEALSLIMPKITGVHKGRRFWDLLLGHHITAVCGIIEDCITRMHSLPEKDYILGVSGETSLEVPISWRDSNNLIFVDDAFRRWVNSTILSKTFDRSETVDYQVGGTFRFDDQPSIKNKLNYYFYRLMNNHHLVYSRLKGLYRNHVSAFFRDPKKVRSLIWDNFHFFYSLKDPGYIFRSELIKGEEESSTLDYGQADAEKRDLLRKEIESPVGEILAQTLPLCSLEGLKEIVACVDLSRLDIYPSLNRIYSHGQIIVEYDFWRVAGALLADKGMQIISVQHGGGINYYSHPSKFLESQMIDENISWGFKDWHIKRKDKFSYFPPRPLPSKYLSHLKKVKAKQYQCEKNKKWEAIFLVLAENRGIKWLYSPLFPDLAHDYFQRENVLFRYFNDRKNSVVKIYPVEYGWNHKQWVDEKFVHMTSIVGGKNFVDLVKDARLVIIDYNSTGFLEMLTLGSPFLCTWNRKWYRGHDLFEACVDQLKQAKIFYETPEELVKEYEKNIHQDINTWWYQSDRVNIVRTIAEKIALTSENVDEIWSLELNRPGQNK